MPPLCGGSGPASELFQPRLYLSPSQFPCEASKHMRISGISSVVSMLKVSGRLFPIYLFEWLNVSSFNVILIMF